MQDVLVALRQFRKSPAFAATVILTIALGIGANTAIFTLVHAILLQSLPVSDPKTLLRVGDLDDCCVNGGFINENGDFDLFSYELYKHLDETTPEFEHLAAMQSASNEMSVRRNSEPAKSLRTEYVSGNYFETLGVSTFAGRVLGNADDHAGAAPAAVMSYQSWQSNYGGDPKLLGVTLYLQGKPVTLVGIAPAGFFGDRIRSNPPEVWIPLADEPLLEGKTSNLHVAESNWLYLLGRVKPGVSITALDSKMSINLRQWLATQPAYIRNGGATLVPRQHVVIVPGGAGIENLQQETGKGLYLLMAISGLVLLVACANIANLLLARGATRKADTSIRIALGAARTRLIRQTLTESVLLACAGGVAGLAVAYVGTRMILALAFPDAPSLPIKASPSLMVLGFAFLLSLATGVVFGVVPAWIMSHSDPADTLRGSNRTTRDRVTLPQRCLIVFQAALSLVLLVGAGLLTKSLGNLERQDFGLQTTGRYVFHLDPAGAGYTAETLPALYQTLEQQFGSLPGVQSVGMALYSPLEGNNWGEGVYVDGHPAPGPNDHNNSSWDRVSSHFFETVGQPVIRGRGITEDDTATSRMVAVVNQTFVKKFFPKEDPIGRHFGDFDQRFATSFEIVGIVADAKYSNPREEVRPMYFRPLTQTLPGLTEPNFIMAEGRSLYINSVTLHFQRPPQNLDALIRHTLANINPNLTMIDLNSLDYQVATNFTQERLVARLTVLFGALALVLASVGLYGITSYQVARRTNEIGLRMALGANRANVLGMVIRGAIVQASVGLALGVPIAVFGARYMADQLYHVRSYDPLSLAVAVLVLSASAMLAAFLPARRAANIEPLTALRME
jgi:predicted permease